MSDKEIEVSVVCLVYNHEKYIEKTLAGFVNQKTNFLYEVIIHDDASTDNSAQIILEYSKKYPDIIKPIFQKENLYSKKRPIQRDYILPIIQGKFIALCEGDDFWIDDNKLQKQYDIMINNEDCSMCTHIVQGVNEDGSSSSARYPSFELLEKKIGVQEYLDMKWKYPFQTSCYFMRTKLWKELLVSPPEFRRKSKVGDEPMLLFMVTMGKIYFIPEIMSCYRRFSVGSYSMRIKRNRESSVRAKENLYEVMCLFDEYTHKQYDCHLGLYRGSFLLAKGNFKEILKKENREYWNKMGLLKKIFIILGSIFPKIGEKILQNYFGKL